MFIENGDNGFICFIFLCFEMYKAQMREQKKSLQIRYALFIYLDIHLFIASGREFVCRTQIRNVSV